MTYSERAQRITNFPKIMKQLNHLVLSVYCGNSQEIADILEPIQRQAEQFFEHLQNAPTQEEKDELEKLFDEYSRAVEVFVQELVKAR